MQKKDYPEILALKAIYEKHHVSISVSANEFLANNKDYPSVVLSLDNKSYKLFVDDEYKDFLINNPFLNFCLVLRELEDYEYANDYLEWCKHHAFDVANSQVRDYYISLGNIYRNVEKILGKINSQISNYDFELDSGAARKLRIMDNNEM